MNDDRTDHGTTQDTDAIGVAQEYHDDPAPAAAADARRAARREHELRERQADHEHGRALARTWAPVTALVLLAVLALIGFVVHAMTDEHAAEHRHQVHVWCYADPNAADATSEFVGAPDDVLGKCPDGRYYAPGQTAG